MALEHEFGTSEEMNQIILSAIHNTLIKEADRGFLGAISVLRRLFEGRPGVDGYLFNLVSDDTDDLKVFYILSALINCWPTSQYIDPLLDFCLFGNGRWVSRDAALDYIADKDNLKLKYKDRISEIAREGANQTTRRATFLALSFFVGESAKIKFIEDQYQRFENAFDRSRFYKYVEENFSDHPDGRAFLEKVRENDPSVVSL